MSFIIVRDDKIIQSSDEFEIITKEASEVMEILPAAEALELTPTASEEE